MEGAFLRFYLDDKHSHHGVLLWEWLLEEANKMGVRGGSAFRAVAGFGRRHHIHEDRFFELAGSATVEVEFIVNDREAEQLMALVEQEKLRLFYARIPANFGIINPDAGDLAAMAADA